MIQDPFYCDTSQDVIADDSGLGTSTKSTGGSKGSGRRQVIGTVILSQFNRVNSDKPPKLEYIRGFFNRFEKKIVRQVLEGNQQPQFCCSPEPLVRMILDNRDELISSDAGGTDSDPSKSSEFKSFEAAFMRKYFSNAIMNDLHDRMIKLIFETYSQPVIEKFLRIRVKDISNSHRALCSLKLLLLSPYFKGVPKSEEELKDQIAMEGRRTLFHFEDSDELDGFFPID